MRNLFAETRKTAKTRQGQLLPPLPRERVTSLLQNRAPSAAFRKKDEKILTPSHLAAKLHPKFCSQVHIPHFQNLMKTSNASRDARPTNSPKQGEALFSFFPFVVSLRRWRVATSFSLGIALALLILSLPAAMAQSTTHRHSNQDFNTLSVAGNNNLKGIWSDGKTMWVADNSDGKLYAYNLATKQRDLAQDFPLDAENANPSGIWSDGTTMWVSDWDDDKLYAYNLAAKSRDAVKDFDTLKAAGNTNPTGIWSDGTTIWIADSQGGKLYAYKMSDESRDATKDFNPQTLSADGNRFPQGIWSDGTTLWVSDFQGIEDHEENKIYAYNLKTKSREAAKDFNTLNAAGNDKARGIWSDGKTMWVADQTDNKIYAYHALFFASRNPVQDFDALNAAGNNAPRGMWSDEQTLWVADAGDGKLYAYDLATKQRDYGKDFDTLKAAGNTHPIGLWSDKTTMWVVDWEDDKLYAYKMSDKTHDSAKDFDTLKAAGNINPTGIWSDGTTMWVSDTADIIFAYKISDKTRDNSKDIPRSVIGSRYIQGIWSDGTTLWAADYDASTNRNSKIYAFNLLAKTRAATKDFDTLNAAENIQPRGLWSDGTTMWVTDSQDDKIYAYRLSDAASLIALNLTSKIPSISTGSATLLNPAFDGGTARYTASVPYASTNFTISPTALYTNSTTVSILPTDADATTTGHQVALNIGVNEIEITVTNALANSLPRTRTYTVNVKREFFTFNDPTKDIVLTSTSSMLRDIWVNDTTMWVADSGTTFTNENDNEYRKILAYNWTTKQPNPNKNFNLVSENDAPRGLWSDKTTMYVADAGGKIHAYGLTNRQPLNPTDDFNLHADNTEPQGIWSDGTTMWAADSRKRKIYAYKMSNKSRYLDERGNPSKDIDLALDNSSPTGIWSDGATMWVADKEDAKLYAYKLSENCPEPGKDFNTLKAVGNTDPWGLWSDGTTMWVLDSEDKKLYAYNQPLSGNASLKSLKLSGVYISTNLFSEAFSRDAPHYTTSDVRYNDAYVVYSTTSTTVEPTLSDSSAVFNIQPPDADPNTPNHQVTLAEGDNTISITVVAENKDAKQYTVNVTRKSGGRTSVKDFNLAMENTQPRAIWLDGTTWRVADANGKIYVYNGANSVTSSSLSTGNAHPQGLWSNNETEIRVTDNVSKKIYFYNLSMNPIKNGDNDKIASIPRPPGANRASQHLPRGLWSNGTTIWVANEGAIGTPPERKIYAYTIVNDASGTRLDPKPANNITLDGKYKPKSSDTYFFNTNPRELWSDGTTMWVEDSQRIYAYNMRKVNDQGNTVWDGAHDQHKDIDIGRLERNQTDRGIWSDGTTMWVAKGRKLYAYNLPQPGASTQSDDSEDSTLKDLKLSGVTLLPAFFPDHLFYTALVDHTVASTTVTASPNDSGATVDILWSSNLADTIHTANRGPQVSLKEGYNIIAVDVTAENGSIQTYLVEVTKAEAPPVSGGPLPAFQSASVGNNPSASSSAGLEEWKSRLIFAEPLLDGGVRFVFVVSAEEFAVEETVDLLGETWRTLPDDEVKILRESSGAGPDRLAIILPKAAGKQRFLRLTPQR